MQAQVPGGHHHLPLGVPPQAAPGQGLLPQVHQVEQPREGRLQTGGQQGRLPAVGSAQEQAGHELRDDGAGAALLLPARHPGQGGRPAPRLPVRRCAQDRRHRRSGLQRGVNLVSLVLSNFVVTLVINRW